MAATIVSTPATGATDWTDWIVQQGLTDRGFSRVSLTNFAGTVASAIGTGSVFELAGSIYNNTTETAISLATGTASAAVAVYILAIPAAGGTTCTFQLDSTAPTWIDAKQGFYASAASTTRAIGGMYIGTAATYYTKFLYTQEMITAYLLPHGETRPILKKRISIGDWDMNSAGTFIFPHGLVLDRIRAFSGIIKDDAEGLYDSFAWHGSGANDQKLYGIWATAGNIILSRTAGGPYDNANYSAASITRGWVIIEYEA